MSAIDESRESATGETPPRRGRGFSPGRIGSSLRHRNYRLYFFGQLVSVMGTWMQTVAQSFLVLDLTHSGTDLGLVTAARFLPILLFGPAGGLFADRRDKRRILYVTQALSGLLAAIFAILTGTHVIQMWLVYVLALSLGFVNVFDNPARQSFISEMVPPDDLAERRHPQLGVPEPRPRVRGGGRRCAGRRARPRAVLRVQRDLVRRRNRVASGDERGAALPGQAGEEAAGPDQARACATSARHPSC